MRRIRWLPEGKQKSGGLDPARWAPDVRDKVFKSDEYCRPDGEANRSPVEQHQDKIHSLSLFATPDSSL